MPRIDNISIQLLTTLRASLEAGVLKLSPSELDYIINYDIKYRMGLNGKETDADD